MERVVVISGSREGHPAVERWLEAYRVRHPVRLWVVGDANGVDAQAWEWLKARGLPWRRYVADWAGLGANAGPQRNADMLQTAEPEETVLLAFPRGAAKGTSSAWSIARVMGIERYAERSLVDNKGFWR